MTVQCRKYNRILDPLPFCDGLAANTLTIRLEGSVGEDAPSDMHRYDLSFPAEVGSYWVDFTAVSPRHRYRLQIKRVCAECMEILFKAKNYRLHEGVNLLFTEKEYQASYDGPWFTGVDEWQAVWMK